MTREQGSLRGLPERPWSRARDDVLETLRVDPDEGLGEEEVERRREIHGANRLREVEQESVALILLRQFKSLIMLVLAVAAGTSMLFGHWIDALAILAAIVINAGIGFVTELRALRSMEALQQMDRKYASVLRGGRQTKEEAEGLVPGDIVNLEGGDLVTADLRVLEANNLQVDESALTGESVPVSKDPEPVPEDAPLAERSSMLFKGTAVTRGSGLGAAVTTGMKTELGGVTSLVQEAEGEEDPLRERLDDLASRLVKGIVIVALIAGMAGLLAGKDLFFMLETAVALFVAAVPEGLPIVATLALARGMHRMAERNALVRRLSAVQTLGAVNVLLTDKTGTLTENRMRVAEALLADGAVTVEGNGRSTSGGFRREGREMDPTEEGPLLEALKVGVLCNNAALDEAEAVGDPTEVALLAWGARAGIRRDELLEEMEEVREVSFDPDTKMMATVHAVEDHLMAAVKGAPDAVLERCGEILTGPDETRRLGEEEKDSWREENRRMASRGRRVLALARRTMEESEEEIYRDLVFLGFVGLLDPVRDEVREPVETCRAAGIRTVMVTGDQKETATFVGEELGLLGEEAAVCPGSRATGLEDMSDDEREALLQVSVFYRVSPEQKLNLIALHQASGSIVGMTGDGVNDAPALKRADIGIAMGERGEPVAEDAADIILQDDRFATIAMAVEQGRVIFENIRGFVVYMISGNIGEILLVFLAAVLGSPLPLLPLQILYINAVNDIFPALALGVGPGSGQEMKRPPRDRDEPVMTRRHWVSMGVFGAMVGLPILAGFWGNLAILGMPEEEAVTVAFLSVAFARLWHVFNMREPGSGLLRNRITRNPLVWGALALCTGLLLLAVYLPPLARVLSVATLPVHGWIMVGLTSLVPLLLGQVMKELEWV